MASAEIKEPLMGEFAFWGPTGSGKDWMLRSFARALEQYNDNRSDRYDGQFQHTLAFGNGRPLPTEPPPPGVIIPTLEGAAYDDRFRYSRVGRSRPMTKAQRVSSHSHEILVTNAAGGDTVNLERSFEVGATLQSAQCVLMLLDHTLISETGALTGQGYINMVRDFLDYLEPLPDRKRRYIAACLTKVDRLTIIRDAGEAVRLTFGRGMEQLLTSYSHRGTEVRFFAVSAFGFLRAENRKPNLDGEKVYLQDPYHWRPHNVEQPFFWLFEQMERSRLGTFTRPLGRTFFLNERRQRYIAYPEGRR